MAEKTLRKVEDELSCSICLETYTDPKLLQCFHEFCQKCLVKLVAQDQQGQLSLTCPICRQVTPIPANGVVGLRPAFRINHLLEIMKEHKKAATTPSPSAGELEKDSTKAAPCNRIKISCPDHGGKEVELYCETCEDTICWKCALKGGKHHSHDYEELDNAFEKYKVEIAASLEPVEKQLTIAKKALAELDTCCGEVSDQQAGIEADIHETFRELQEMLNVRKTKLIHQLHQLTQGKLKRLAVQRDLIETKQAQLSSCLIFMKESLKTDSQGEALMMKRNLVNQVKELTTFPSDLLKPTTEMDVVFSTDIATVTACQNYGQVKAVDLLDPSKCYVAGSNTRTAVIGETTTAILHAVNFKNQPCKGSIQSLECELVHEITGTRIRGSVARMCDVQYKITYQPTIKGRHQLHIKIDSQHIKDSPFSVVAISSVLKLDTPVKSLDGLEEPEGVAITPSGMVIVTEWKAHRVSILHPNGAGDRLLSFGTRGSGLGQFIHPAGVAVNDAGNILVTDWGNHRIHKFTAAGQFLTTVGSKGSGLLQFCFPYGIAVSAKNNAVYVTDNNHRVQILTSDLTFTSTFGRRGKGTGQFISPHGIACDSTGNVYVADHFTHRIQVFTAEGKFLREFGVRGKACGTLNEPSGIAIDTNDMVYITEFDNHRVSVFTCKGEFVTSFGSCGGKFGQFQSPLGICVDNSGIVYVCDNANMRLQLLC